MRTNAVYIRRFVLCVACSLTSIIIFSAVNIYQTPIKCEEVTCPAWECPVEGNKETFKVIKVENYETFKEELMILSQGMQEKYRGTGKEVICPIIVCPTDVTLQSETAKETSTVKETTEKPVEENEHTTANNGEDFDFRREIAKDLLEISLNLQGLEDSISNKMRMKLNSIIGRLDPRYSLSLVDTRARDGDVNVYDEADTCGEVYHDRKQGYPYYQTGFTVSPKCPTYKRTRPISNLVSVILIDTKGKYSSSVLEGIRKYSNDMPVFLASNMYNNSSYNIKNISIFTASQEELRTPGKVLNSLVSSVKTPYVLIAKDLTHFTNYSRMERLVYLLPKSSPVGVAAGSTRNFTGHWSQGCQQTEIKNYLLRITRGYPYSTQDCMFCDYVSGPFLAKTNVLSKVTFDESLPFQVIFHDWFLQLKDSGILAVTCPDIMFFIHGEEEPTRQNWLTLTRKHEISRIFISPDRHFKYSCEELSLSCNPWDWTEFYLLPTCCFEEIANALSKLHSFSEVSNMTYELESGSLLAAVKLQGHSPWDLDGDIQYNKTFFKDFLKYSGVKSARGIYFGEFENKYKKFKIFTPNIYLEMWSRKIFSCNLYLPDDLKGTPTLMEVLGLWIRGQANPGLYARNKYGPNHLKHAVFYLFNKMGEWDEYKTAGKWPSCPRKHHACTNRYPADGSVHFIPHYFENLGIAGDDIWK